MYYVQKLICNSTLLELRELEKSPMTAWHDRRHFSEISRFFFELLWWQNLASLALRKILYGAVVFWLFKEFVLLSNHSGNQSRSSVYSYKSMSFVVRNEDVRSSFLFWPLKGSGQNPSEVQSGCLPLTRIKLHTKCFTLLIWSFESGIVYIYSATAVSFGSRNHNIYKQQMRALAFTFALGKSLAVFITKGLHITFRCCLNCIPHVKPDSCGAEYFSVDLTFRTNPIFLW